MVTTEQYNRVYLAIEQAFHDQPGPVDPKVAKATQAVFRVIREASAA